jgi:acetyl esterase/lipase
LTGWYLHRPGSNSESQKSAALRKGRLNVAKTERVARPGIEVLESRLAASAARPVAETIAYGPDHRQNLDVYQPAAHESPAPVAFLVHGGGWAYGDKSKMRAFVPYFLSRGYVVANVNYRLTTPASNQFPVPAQDVAAALVWVKAHADDFNADPARVVGFGQSAGGELLGMVAYDPEGDWLDGSPGEGQDLSLAGFIGSSGVYDMRTAPHRWEFGCFLAPLTGAPCGPGRTAWDGRLAGPASPAAFVDAGDPPALLFVGTADPVYASMGRAFHLTLRGAGIPSTLYPLARLRHADIKLVFPRSRPIQAAVDVFLASLEPTTPPNTSGGE